MGTGGPWRTAVPSPSSMAMDKLYLMWLICIVPIQGHPGLWRAYTGWPAEPEDEKWYGKSK